MKFNLHYRTKIPAIFGGCCFVVLSLAFFLRPSFLSLSEHLTITVTLLTAVGGITAFLYSKHNHETELFLDLFRDFNSRYDNLNEKLNEIYNRPKDEELKPTDHGLLYDYFNLCAEEQMFARAGCIDSSVWRAWQNGMRYFAQDPEIRDFWQRELQQDSYYGFRIPQ
jgi:hypothetical protein